MLNQCLENVELKIFPPSSPAPATSGVRWRRSSSGPAQEHIGRRVAQLQRPAGGGAPAAGTMRTREGRPRHGARSSCGRSALEAGAAAAGAGHAEAAGEERRRAVVGAQAATGMSGGAG